MARGSSQSQKTSSSTALCPGVVAPCSSAATIAGMRCRRLSGGGGSGAENNMFKFCTNDAPGLKITPTVMLVMMSLCFIGFITALHVFGKLYLH